jgi:3-hydroxyisobutyrate dehydrogenase
MLRAGMPTIVWNRRRAATRDLAGLGADVAETAADAARRAGVVVTMVTDTDAVLSIARDQGMLAALAPGAIWVQMATIGVAGIERVAAMVQAERPDVTLLDAPVSGSREPAEQGQLTIFASGPEEARPRVAGLFDALGQRTIWVGEVGAGSQLKLVNNTLVAFAAEGVANAAALAGRLGLATETVIEGLAGSPLVSPWQAAKLQRIAKGEFSAQFALSLALKDVRLALQAADDDRFTAFACLAEEWQRAVEQGLGDQDLTVVKRWLEQQKGGGRRDPDRLHHDGRAGGPQAAGPRGRAGRAGRLRLRGHQRPLLPQGPAAPRPPYGGAVRSACDPPASPTRSSTRAGRPTAPAAPTQHARRFHRRRR